MYVYMYSLYHALHRAQATICQATTSSKRTASTVDQDPSSDDLQQSVRGRTCEQSNWFIGTVCACSAAPPNSRHGKCITAYRL